jgi:hypothetical protein
MARLFASNRKFFVNITRSVTYCYTDNNTTCANELVQHTPIIGLNWVNFIFSKGLVNASATLSPVDTYTGLRTQR